MSAHKRSLQLKRRRALVRRHRRQARRGVLLLVVLSMLFIFLMTAVAFIVVARHFHQSTKVLTEIDKIVEPAEELVDAAMYDLLRDTLNPNSRLRYHSLLRDLYGNDGFVVDGKQAKLQGAASVPNTGGQFLDLAVFYDPNVLPLSPVTNYYNGQVLTMAEGPASGMSTRIVRYWVESVAGNSIAYFRVLAFHRNTQYPTLLVPQPGDRFLVNGRPLNGTGVGFDPFNRFAEPGEDQITLDYRDPTDRPYALLPNSTFFEPTLHATDRTRQYGEFPGLGGSDEGYDAADMQNMLLAHMPFNPTIPSTPAFPPTHLLPAEVDRIIQPSLHRRALINYWLTRPDPTSTNPTNELPWNPPLGLVLANPAGALQEAYHARKAVLRPLPADHPHFPRLASLINGPWDVDNDGDGVPDSVWVDLGYPSVKMPDGRFYKPMFAIMVQDMDGRLNLNAHGSREEVIRGRDTDAEAVLASANSSSPQTALRQAPGQGYGPPEVSLSPLLTDVDYSQLVTAGDVLNVRTFTGFNGRYGVDQFPGAHFDHWDPLAQMKFSEYPAFYDAPGTINDVNAYKMLANRGFGTPPDLKGRFGLGVDFNGFPNFTSFFERSPSDANFPGETMVQESPYEINLMEEGPTGELFAGLDTPFTEAELERVLRAHDADVGHLPDRLLRLTEAFTIGGSGGLVDGDVYGENARSVTVRSFDLPVPGLTSPADVLADARNSNRATTFGYRPHNVVDLLIARLEQENGNLNVGDLDRLARRLLSPDVADNLRLDLNRPFGDGRDNDGDGAVDDPEESGKMPKETDGMNDAGDRIEKVEEGVDSTLIGALPANARPIYNAGNKRLDHAQSTDVNGDGNVNALDSLLARQLMARHLYVLAFLAKDADYDFPFVDNAINTPQERKRFTALRLAQWAINAVDFRDPDAIMTAFEVDLDPFVDNDGDPDNGTWDVDGNPATVDDQGSPTPYRAVVWGLEKPQLLITETLATHDLRVRDTGMDSSGNRRDENGDGPATDPNDEDEDCDQYRIPQGSLFVEMLCMGNPTNAVMPGELYRWEQNRWQLDLGRHPLARNGNGVADNPVWRLAISRAHPEEESVRFRFRQHPETTTFQPEQVDLIDRAEQVELQRYVWFSTRRPTGRVRDANRIFWNINPAFPALVPAGHYAVLGPRLNTSFGSQVNNVGERRSAEQRITLGRGATRYFDNPGGRARPFIPMFDVNSNGNGNVKPAFGIVAGIDTRPPGWSRDMEIGVNISEPLPGVHSYYPEPTVRLPNAPAGDPADAYGDESAPGNFLPDEPLDLRANRPIADLAGGLINTHQNIRTIFLQRLADPTMPWNPADVNDPLYDANLPINPYITVDWQPVDLTVFNGEDRTPNAWSNAGGTDGGFIAQGRTGDIQTHIEFSSRERGLRQPGGNTTADNIWRAESHDDLDVANVNVPANSAEFFSRSLQHSIGYLNSTYGFPVAPLGNTSANGTPITPQQKALALGAPSNLANRAQAKPFPWLVWNDRPYVSPHELMQVPISAPGRLTVEHSVARENMFVPYNPTDAVSNAYDNPPNLGDDDVIQYTNPNATFGHLLNFFASDATATQPAPNFYRLLEYTGVKSRFVGTELVVNPVVFSNDNFDTALRRPPFNRISKYREPGRVNWNTITGTAQAIGASSTTRSKTYQGLFHGDPGDVDAHEGPNWQLFVANRRGYQVLGPQAAALTGKMFAMNNNFPTFFAGHFGSPDAGHLVPLPQMRREGVDMGLLRRRNLGGGDRGDKLHELDSAQDQPLFQPTASTASEVHRDPDTHSYFRYQPMQRLSNLTTSRSNVYAVWITVGFFEMEPVPPSHRQAVINSHPTGDAQLGLDLFNRLYPEGMWLSRELGSDTGESKRYRGFYMIDRSIPVGFEPGRNHNVDRAILLRRRIE